MTRPATDADTEIVGSVTTGGTESCLLAVKTARDVWRAAPAGRAPRACSPQSPCMPRSTRRPTTSASSSTSCRSTPTGRWPPRSDRAVRTRRGAGRRLGAGLPAREPRPGRRGGCRGIRGRDRLPRRRLHRRLGAALVGRATCPPGTSACPASRASRPTCTSSATPRRASRCCCSAAATGSARSTSRPPAGPATPWSTRRCSARSRPAPLAAAWAITQPLGDAGFARA